jgi:hypothetical protein
MTWLRKPKPTEVVKLMEEEEEEGEREEEEEEEEEEGIAQIPA